VKFTKHIRRRDSLNIGRHYHVQITSEGVRTRCCKRNRRQGPSLQQAESRAADLGGFECFSMGIYFR
jgi:hypothetical protein